MATNFFDLASLVMIPSGWKAGKVYSVKPDSGDGDFTFARNSTATRTNSAGLVETMAVDVPRLQYPSCPSLLLEPARTNEWSNSEPEDGTGFTLIETTIEAFDWSPQPFNSFSTHFGDNSITREIRRTTAAYVGTNDYTMSVFVKMVDGGTPVAGNNFDSSADFSLRIGNTYPTNANTTYTDLGNNIWLVTGTVSVPDGANAGLNGVSKFTGQSAREFDIVGYQIEQGTYPTTYIKTEGSTVNRGRDGMDIQDMVANGISAANNTYYLELTNAQFNAGLATYYCEAKDSGGTRCYLLRRTGNTNITVQSLVGGSTITVILTGNPDHVKIAIKFDSGVVTAYANGIAGDTTSAYTGNPVDELEFNQTFAIEGARVKEIHFYPTALTDAQLIELTT